MSKNVIEHRVEWGETDAAGIVYYPNFYRWFDLGTHSLFRALGIPMKELDDKYSFGQPIMESGCRFMAPLRYDDVFSLETEVVEVRTRTFKVQHRLYLDSRLVGEGFEVRAWVKFGESGPEGKLAAVAIPPEMAELLKN